jgi:protein-S-isoprenylcysteine O-methyltransferase Ste14
VFSSLIHPFLARYSDDALMILALLTASPEILSLSVGAVVSLWGWILILWQRGYGLSLAARSFPALLFSLSLLPLLYRYGINSEDRVLEKNDLETYRYQQYVPALVPTLFPYRRPGDDLELRFSWRRALFKQDAELKHALVVVLFAWPLLVFRLQTWLPHWGLWVAAGIWLAILIGWEFSRHRHRGGLSTPSKRR